MPRLARLDAPGVLHHIIIRGIERHKIFTIFRNGKMKRKIIHKKNDEVRLVLGVTWYTPEEFFKMKRTAIDGDNFEDTYEEWRQVAEKTMNDLKRQGINPRKVYVKTEEFRWWCEKNNLDTNGPSRTRYVAENLKSENNSKITSE